MVWGKEEFPKAVDGLAPPNSHPQGLPAPIAPWHGSVGKAVGDRGAPGQDGVWGRARQRERREAGSCGEAGAEPGVLSPRRVRVQAATWCA